MIADKVRNSNLSNINDEDYTILTCWQYDKRTGKCKITGKNWSQQHCDHPKNCDDYNKKFDMENKDGKTKSM
jgi:hypothetical protein